MLRSTIEKFYNFLFLDEDQEEEVPYANKAFMFYFSIIVFLVVVVLMRQSEDVSLYFSLKPTKYMTCLRLAPGKGSYGSLLVHKKSFISAKPLQC